MMSLELLRYRECGFEGAQYPALRGPIAILYLMLLA